MAMSYHTKLKEDQQRGMERAILRLGFVQYKATSESLLFIDLEVTQGRLTGPQGKPTLEDTHYVQFHSVFLLLLS